MKIFTSYFSGLKSASRSKKMATLIFVITFMLAMIVAIPFQTTLKNEAGNSMAINSLLKHFDYTTYSDFMRVSGKAVKPFITSGVWMGMFYLLFTVFFAGGVLNILSGEENKFSIKSFLDGCGKFFFRYLRLAIYIVIIEFIIALVVFIPLSMILASAYRSVQSEASLFYIFIIGVLIFALLFILVLMIGDYAKILLFKDDSKKAFKAVWISTKFVFKHFFGTYSLYLLLLIAPVLFFVIYFFLDNSIGMVSGFTIFIMFLIQQILIWLRTWTKVWFLGSEIKYFELTFESNEPAINIESVQSTEISSQDLTGNI